MSINQGGLEWVSGTFGLEPRWTIQPDLIQIEHLARKHLNIPSDSPCDVAFYAQGAFNKLYKITTRVSPSTPPFSTLPPPPSPSPQNHCFLLRVTLPVDPQHKTNSEVATIKFIRDCTEIPVPRILAFGDSADTELGFEWILMEMIPGVTLRTRWRTMSSPTKRDLVKGVARYQAQLFQRQLSGIGNLYTESDVLSPSADVEVLFCPTSQVAFASNRPFPAQPEDPDQSDQSYKADQSEDPREPAVPERCRKSLKTYDQTLGPIVSMIFFWGNHIKQNVSRGPFTSSHDWIYARLTLVLADQDQIITTSADPDDIEEASECTALAQHLLQELPHIFPSDDKDADPSILFHDDLSMQNILVDDHGHITGIVDWECVSALPLWRACALPEFLQGRPRNSPPDISQYAPDPELNTLDPNLVHQSQSDTTSQARESELDNAGVDDLYWAHLLEYELTQLREVYLAEMKILAPEWMECFQRSGMKADFDAAVLNCDNGWRASSIRAWLQTYKTEERFSLRERFLQ